MTQSPEEYISSFLDRPSESVCPVFKENENEMEQFASGVFIRIGNEVFLLTASHVMDEIHANTLWIPGKESIIQLTGSFSQIRLPECGKRDKDRLDIAYMKLDADSLENLHPSLAILDFRDCDAFDTTAQGDPYTIVGYPAVKAKAEGHVCSSEITTLTGEALSVEEYSNLGLSTENHIVFKFPRKKGIKPSTGERVRLHKIEGMSGGGVFSWDKNLPDPSALSSPKLCGIFHEYHKTKHYFVATRLHCFIACILKNNPNLPVTRTPPQLRSREKEFDLSQKDKDELSSAFQEYMRRKRKSHNQAAHTTPDSAPR